MTKKSARRRYYSLLIFVLLLTAISFGFFVFRFQHAYQYREWNEESEFIVFDSHALEIKVYTPKSERIRTYHLPKEAYVEVPEGYGFYKIKDITELSRVEKRGEELAVMAVSNAFGIPFDASPATLTDWDKLLIWYSGWAYEEKDYSVDLSVKPLFTKETRADGIEMQIVAPEKVDAYLRHELWEKAITDDGLVVGIFNASGEPNVASTISRKLENIGVQVTEMSNWQEDVLEVCMMRVKPEKRGSYTARRLMRLFECRMDETEPLSRFDIMLIATRTL